MLSLSRSSCAPTLPVFTHILYNSHMLLISVGFHFKGRVLLWFVFLFSVLTILLEVVFLIVWAILGAEWELADAWWMKLIGLMKWDFILSSTYPSISALVLLTRSSFFEIFATFWVRGILSTLSYMLLQTEVMEVPLSNLSLGSATISCWCCFVWNQRQQISLGSAAGFSLGTFLISSGTYWLVQVNYKSIWLNANNLFTSWAKKLGNFSACISNLKGEYV